MKKLIAFIASLLVLSSVAQATLFSTNVVGAATNLLTTGYYTINRITAVNAGTQTVTLTFFDNNVLGLTYSNNVYTNYVVTQSYITNIYTSFIGLSVTNIYPIVSNVLTTVAAKTNNMSPSFIMLIPTNNTVTYTPVRPVPVTRGVVATNTDSISIVVDYDRQF